MGQSAFPQATQVTDTRYSLRSNGVNHSDKGPGSTSTYSLLCRVKKNSLPATKVQVFYSELTGKLIYKKKTAAILLVFLTLLEHNLLGSQWITIERMATNDKWDKI